MRSQELALAMMEIKHAPWFDGRAIIAGTSEGGVTAARYQADEKMIQEKGRMIFSWSCEDNYHVESHNTHIPEQPPGFECDERNRQVLQPVQQLFR